MIAFYLLTLLVAPGSTLQGIELGYSTIRQDTIAGETVLEYGEVPRWLEGSLLRQACGSYGETGSTLDIRNRVNHLLDCIEMGQSFRFKDGEVTFYNRYFDTAIVDVWRSYNMNMNDSRVFWQTIYTNMDWNQVQRHWFELENTTVRTKVRQMPHVTWWQIGNKVVGHSEYPNVVEVDAHEVTNSLQYHVFNDNNFGYTNEAIVDEASHETMDRDGTLYCSHQTYRFDALHYMVHQWKTVYRIVYNSRSIVAQLPYPSLDLRLCNGTHPYPIGEHRQGYMHSFTMTENYILIPESSYLCDICSVIPHYQPNVPFYTQFWDWDGNVPSRMWVIRKTDGRIMANISTTAFFVTHQINAYEENGNIYADMMTYNHGRFYTQDTWVDYLTGTVPYEAWMHRFTINVTDWTMTRSNLLPYHAPIELPMINQEYRMRPYRYVYYTRGIHTGLNQTFTKHDVTTGTLIEYPMPDGFFPQEPTYMPRQGARTEDDGIILLAGVDSVKAKGFLMIFDAHNLTLTAHLTGTDLMLAGLHSKFFPPHIGVMEPREEVTDPIPPNSAVYSVTFRTVLAGFSLVLVVLVH